MLPRKISKDLIKRIVFDEDTHNAIWKLEQYLLARNEEPPEYGLNRVERNITLYCNYIGEVFHGGHSLFFMNPASNYIQRTLDGLEGMKLFNLESILIEAIGVFPPNEDLGEQKHRINLLKNITQDESDLLDALDKKVAENELISESEVVIYIRKNHRNILVQETDGKKFN